MGLLHSIKYSALAMAAAVSVASGVYAQAPAKRPPNVVFILADDLGIGDLGCYGQDKIKTPNIDALAARGMRFTQAYSPSAVSAPARCGYLTGMHMGHASIRDNEEIQPEGQFPLAADAVTIFQVAKTKGYATGTFGKWGLGMSDTTGAPGKKGVDQFFGHLCQRKAHSYYPPYMWDNDKQVQYPGNKTESGNVYSQDAIDEQMLKFMDSNKDKPYFMFISTTLPHFKLQVPDDEVEPYKNLQEKVAGKNPRAKYAAMVTHLDTVVGKVVSKLQADGLDDNTLIVFTSDNGATGPDIEFFKSNLNYRGTKAQLFEGGIHEPLIIAWPGKIKGGTVSDLPVAGYDYFPTFCEAMQIDVPKKIDGLSILPTLTGQGTQAIHDFLYWEYPNAGHFQAVRMGNYKAIRPFMQRKLNRLTKENANKPADKQLTKEQIIEQAREIEIYDLSVDPSESNNIAASHPDLVAKAAKIMAEQHVPNKTFPLATFEPTGSRKQYE